MMNAAGTPVVVVGESYTAMKKWLHRFWKLCAWLLLVLFLLFVEENVRGRILLSVYKHHLRAQGEKLTLAELSLDGAPAPLDAATVDLLAAAKKLPDWNPDNRWESQTLHFMNPVVPGAATFSWQMPIGQHRIVGTNWGSSTWLDVVGQLLSNEPTITAAVQALRRDPQGVTYNYRAETDEFVLSANRSRENLRYWLMWMAANDMRESRLDEAGESVLAIARLGRTFYSYHPGYYKKFMGFGLDATWDLLHLGITNDQELAGLQDIWSHGAIVPELPKLKETWRAWNISRIEAQRFHWDDFLKTTNAVEAKPLELRNVPPLTMASWYLTARYFDEYVVLLFWQSELRQTRLVSQTCRWDSWPDERKFPWLEIPWVSMMPFACSRGANQSLREGMLRIFEFETQREMTVAAIALQRFRIRHGDWPDKLENLIPEFLPILPRDWMDGQPLRYRRNADDTFTLYSVGEDLRDDGGDLTPVPNYNFDAHPLPMWTTRDAVWPCIATDENVAAIKRTLEAKKGH